MKRIVVECVYSMKHRSENFLTLSDLMCMTEEEMKDRVLASIANVSTNEYGNQYHHRRITVTFLFHADVETARSYAYLFKDRFSCSYFSPGFCLMHVV